MKSILVTGAKGQLGRCIQDIITEFDGLTFKFTTSDDLDLTDYDAVKLLFKQHNFDYCINCAAYTNVNQAEKTPEIAFAVNAEAVKNLAKECIRHNVILLHLSTDYVFDGEKEGPYTVNDKPNPINEYGKSKLLGEQFIQKSMHRFFIVRTSWLYSNYSPNFYTAILDKAKTQKLLQVTDEETGCPTHAMNLARFLLKIIHKGFVDYGIYHFTDGEAMTWYDFAKRIISKNGLKNRTKVQRAKNNRSFVNRPKNSVLI